MGKASETASNASRFLKSEVKSEKPPFRVAVDDTKPVLQDPIALLPHSESTIAAFKTRQVPAAPEQSWLSCNL
ncbi:hypothetical protein HID58_083154 [Brassica napus]|uniref:Uncharacterized protein n=1 Tax=Brassica napus TaxID=3708 RepID=A0ABQ7YCQ0_BRANA|nr:hypothetical protein HID58_083154 [Brassica napus]